jgi:hypothetical protein
MASAGTVRGPGGVFHTTETEGMVVLPRRYGTEGRHIARAEPAAQAMLPKRVASKFTDNAHDLARSAFV